MTEHGIDTLPGSNAGPVLDVASIAERARLLRRDVIEMIWRAGSGHAGGSLSSAEIVASLYWSELRIRPDDPDWAERDRLVLSKGHCAPIIYAALARRGYFDVEVLSTFRRTGSVLQGHPDMRKTRGLDMTTGSLGQGLSVGLGMALASRQSGQGFRTFVLMSDGEMQEGMTWEAAMAASHLGVGSLTVLVDRNRLQVDGWVREVMDVEPLADKWRAFGWQVLDADGNDPGSVLGAFAARRALPDGRPAVLICRTTKGKGVSFMENVMEWHGGTLSEAQYRQAMAELQHWPPSPDSSPRYARPSSLRFAVLDALGLDNSIARNGLLIAATTAATKVLEAEELESFWPDVAGDS